MCLFFGQIDLYRSLKKVQGILAISLSLKDQFCYSRCNFKFCFRNKLMSASPRFGILGAGGRMGRTLIQAVHQAG